MAQIPIGNFGQSQAQAAPMGRVRFDDPLGAAAERTGQIVQNVATQAVSDETQRQQASMRAQAALTLAKTGNDLHDAHDDVARRVLDGTLPAADAQPEFNKLASKLQDTTLDGWGPDERAAMQGHLVGVRGSLDRSLTGVVVKRQQQDTASTIDQFGEQVSREASRQGPQWAVDKFGSMVDFTGGAAGLNDAQKAKLKQGFSEKVHATFFEQAAVGALTEGSIEKLRTIREQIGGEQGNALDPQKRNQMTLQVFGWEQSLQAKIDRDANAAAEAARKQFNEAAELYNKGLDVAMGGGYLSPEFITQLTQTAAGTEMERPVAGLIGSQATVAGFASLPADKRAERIERYRSARATPGEGVDPIEDKLLTAMTAMDGKLRELVKDNPWAAAQQAGVLRDAPIMSVTSLADAPAVLEQRMKSIAQVELWAGKKVTPFQPAEADMMAKSIKQLPPDQVAAALSAMGTSLADPERIAAVAKQLGATHEPIELAMYLAGDKTTAGRHSSELMLRGVQALVDKTVKRDDTALTGWKSEIATMVNGTLGNPEAESKIKAAAYYIRAAMDDEGARAPGFGTFGSTAAQAVSLAAGLPIERGGVRTLLPRGKTEDQFDDALAKIKAPDLIGMSSTGKLYRNGREVSPTILAPQLTSMGLRRAGDGSYVPVSNGSMVTVDPAGQIPLRIRVP